MEKSEKPKAIFSTHQQPTVKIKERQITLMNNIAHKQNKVQNPATKSWIDKGAKIARLNTQPNRQILIKGHSRETRIAKRRFLTGLQRGYLFWGEGAAIHTQATIKPYWQPLHATESHVRQKPKLIQNIVPFWKTFLTKKKEYHF